MSASRVSSSAPQSSARSGRDDPPGDRRSASGRINDSRQIRLATLSRSRRHQAHVHGSLRTQRGEKIALVSRETASYLSSLMGPRAPVVEVPEARHQPPVNSGFAFKQSAAASGAAKLAALPCGRFRRDRDLGSLRPCPGGPGRLAARLQDHSAAQQPNRWSLVRNIKNLLPLAKDLASAVIDQGFNLPKLRERG